MELLQSPALPLGYAALSLRILPHLAARRKPVLQRTEKSHLPIGPSHSIVLLSLGQETQPVPLDRTPLPEGRGSARQCLAVLLSPVGERLSPAVPGREGVLPHRVVAIGGG